VPENDTQPVQNGVDLLIADHRTAERLFSQFSTTVGAARENVVGELIRELSVHAAVEEQVLYPVARREVPDAAELVDHSLEEHQEVKETLASLEKMDPSTPEAAQLVEQLVSSVREHVQEEETQLFPKLRAKVSEERLDEMGDAIQKAKGMAPTHPHPRAPNTPPGNIVAGAAAAVVDKARDALRRD
jgi:hemerythrin superfamily protein